jgi:hypothetical protein
VGRQDWARGRISIFRKIHLYGKIGQIDSRPPNHEPDFDVFFFFFFFFCGGGRGRPKTKPIRTAHLLTLYASQTNLPNMAVKALIAGGCQVSLPWAPGHMGIAGSEEADRLANEGAQADILSLPNSSSLSHAKRVAKERIKSLKQEYWLANRPSSYAPCWGLDWQDSPPELSLTGHMVMHLTRM